MLQVTINPSKSRAKWGPNEEQVPEKEKDGDADKTADGHENQGSIAETSARF